MLPPPTIQAIEHAVQDFEVNHLVETALRQLWDHFPVNTDPAQVYLKVIALNQIYSTRIRTIELETLVEHIVDLKIDSLLDAGSADVVDQMAACPNIRKCFSFATKYCHWHRPKLYPIWDGNVDAALWAYSHQKDSFRKYHRDGYQYADFREIINAFLAHYQLDVSFKDLDKFLWKIGGDIRSGKLKL